MARALILALCLGLFVSPAWAALGRVEIGSPAPGFSALGSDGRSHALSDYAGKIVVLEWTSPVCPYTALKYQRGLMQAIQGRATKAGVVWLSINTSPSGRPGHLTVEAAKARLVATKAQATSLVLDEDTRIGQAYGVRTTPTVFVIGKDGRIAQVLHGGDPRPAHIDYALDAKGAVPEGRRLCRLRQSFCLRYII